MLITRSVSVVTYHLESRCNSLQLTATHRTSPQLTTTQYNKVQHTYNTC